jgi:hypothetical protein
MESPDNRHTLIVQHVPKKFLSKSIAAQVGPLYLVIPPTSTEIGRPVLPRISAEPATRVLPGNRASCGGSPQSLRRER